MAPVDPSVITANVVATKYAYVASATLLFYDISLTFEKEVATVWQAKKTLGTSLFFINRYLPPVIFFLDLAAQFRFNPDVKFCKNYELSSTILDFAAIAVVEAVLIMRTHALYQNQKLLYALCALGIISIINMATCFLIVLNYLTFVPASTLGLVGCLSGCTSPVCRPLLIAFWIPFMLFETLVFALTARKSYTSYRIARNNQTTRLVSMLFRDGLVYYIIIICVSLFNFFIWIFDPFASYLAVGLLKCLQATICSRLLLNIRGMLEPQTGTTFTSKTSTNGGTHSSTTAKFTTRQSVQPTELSSSWNTGVDESFDMSARKVIHSPSDSRREGHRSGEDDW
ncbi:hypothetical protein FA15DRAFT_675918 [Coprinopsis marcescibilis]|uniref:DUF6533 domain-containing protein n=1 Tax=Coprinopsis marcescibilis TaxID=230819 RepID=A0A5C3KC56_COPMA|nr:hypothetical protein FA15DRAFT_675918 [Coprinopsis marcescibilis]